MILGICGRAGSGKDTVADILVRDHGFVKIAIADPLKRVLKDVSDSTLEALPVVITTMLKEILR